MIRILFVCTANVCRSPMAAAFLARSAGRDADLQVRSAGLLPGGNASPDEVVSVMAPYGLDMRSHVSRQVNYRMVAGADLSIGMTRRHVREMLLLEPSRLPRCFTLKELVRLGEVAGPRPSGVTLRAWSRGLDPLRATSDLIGDRGEDDISDPYGGSLGTYTKSAEELQDLIGRLAGLIRP